MIIWLASYPRSGNTLMRWALRAMGQQDASVYNDSKIDPTLPNLYIRNLGEYEKQQTTYFVKTHARQDDQRKAIYILRDGRDALVSLAHYTVDLVGTDKTYEEVLRLLIDGGYQPPYCTWSEHVLFYLQRKNTLIIRYEKLLENLVQQMTRVAMFCDVKLISPLDVSFEKLHEANPKFYRRGIVGAWKDEMSLELQELFISYHGQAMKAAGYDA